MREVYVWRNDDDGGGEESERKEKGAHPRAKEGRGGIN